MTYDCSDQPYWTMQGRSMCQYNKSDAFNYKGFHQVKCTAYQPVVPTMQPISTAPTYHPTTLAPTRRPTTVAPSKRPSVAANPTRKPTSKPSAKPSAKPSRKPTAKPSAKGHMINPSPKKKQHPPKGPSISIEAVMNRVQEGVARGVNAVVGGVARALRRN